jgi:PIN domain nuclease of toxin-antitoxin system
MKLLVDTHIFLWYIAADPQLPVAIRDAIRNPGNDVFLSVASIWVAVVKYALGKLPLPEPPAGYLVRQREAHLIASLPIEEGAMGYLAALPLLHRDPFDRILVAQALQRGLTMVTIDTAVRAYPVPHLPTV